MVPAVIPSLFQEFALSPINPASTRADILLRKLSEFMQEHVYPAEADVAAWQSDL